MLELDARSKSIVNSLVPPSAADVDAVMEALERGALEEAGQMLTHVLTQNRVFPLILGAMQRTVVEEDGDLFVGVPEEYHQKFMDYEMGTTEELPSALFRQTFRKPFSANLIWRWYGHVNWRNP